MQREMRERNNFRLADFSGLARVDPTISSERPTRSPYAAAF